MSEDFLQRNGLLQDPCALAAALSGNEELNLDKLNIKQIIELPNSRLTDSTALEKRLMQAKSGEWMGVFREMYTNPQQFTRSAPAHWSEKHRQMFRSAMRENLKESMRSFSKRRLKKDEEPNEAQQRLSSGFSKILDKILGSEEEKKN